MFNGQAMQDKFVITMLDNKSDKTEDSLFFKDITY